MYILMPSLVCQPTSHIWLPARTGQIRGKHLDLLLEEYQAASEHDLETSVCCIWADNLLTQLCYLQSADQELDERPGQPLYPLGSFASDEHLLSPSFTVQSSTSNTGHCTLVAWTMMIHLFCQMTNNSNYIYSHITLNINHQPNLKEWGQGQGHSRSDKVSQCDTRKTLGSPSLGWEGKLQSLTPCNHFHNCHYCQLLPCWL